MRLAGAISSFDVIVTARVSAPIFAPTIVAVDYVERGGTVIQYNKMEFNQGE